MPQGWQPIVKANSRIGATLALPRVCTQSTPEMQDLIRKIEADAAARLRLPEGKSPAQELGRYKTFLKIEAHRLKMLHRAGAPGLQICHGRAHIIDVLLRYLWDSVKAGLSEQARKEFPQVSLVAIGGYGRGELNPHSDIDLMFLQNRQVAGNRPLPYLSKIIEGSFTPCTMWAEGGPLCEKRRRLWESGEQRHAVEDVPD
jgi:hypothetical protein